MDSLSSERFGLTGNSTVQKPRKLCMNTTDIKSPTKEQLEISLFSDNRTLNVLSCCDDDLRKQM